MLQVFGNWQHNQLTPDVYAGHPQMATTPNSTASSNGEEGAPRPARRLNENCKCQFCGKLFQVWRNYVISKIPHLGRRVRTHFLAVVYCFGSKIYSRVQTSNAAAFLIFENEFWWTTLFFATWVVFRVILRVLNQKIQLAFSMPTFTLHTSH